MTTLEDIASLRGRISRAALERDAWRAAGLNEKYLESYFLLEALELQLAERQRQHLIDGRNAKPPC